MHLSSSNLLKLAQVRAVVAKRIAVTTVYGLFALGQRILPVGCFQSFPAGNLANKSCWSTSIGSFGTDEMAAGAGRTVVMSASIGF
jgi:hypothetical protein